MRRKSGWKSACVDANRVHCWESMKGFCHRRTAIKDVNYRRESKRNLIKMSTKGNCFRQHWRWKKNLYSLENLCLTVLLSSFFTHHKIRDLCWRPLSLYPPNVTTRNDFCWIRTNNGNLKKAEAKSRIFKLEMFMWRKSLYVVYLLSLSLSRWKQIFIIRWKKTATSEREEVEM